MTINRRTMLTLTAASLPLLATSTAFAQTQAKGMDALECIFTRRSIRKFLDKPVPEDMVKTLLEAAMTAPSAMNEQPWHFITVTSKDKLKAAYDVGCKPAETAALGILVCGDPSLGKTTGTWPLDCSNAAMNILLAANALGLGGVWTIGYPNEKRMADYRTIFNIPAQIMPFNFICLGWPEKPGWREDRFKADRVKKETWG